MIVFTYREIDEAEGKAYGHQTDGSTIGIPTTEPAQKAKQLISRFRTKQEF